MSSQISAFTNTKHANLRGNRITTVGGNLTETHYHQPALAEGRLSSDLLNAIRPPVNCTFNCVGIPYYHDGTRSKLLKELDDWISRSNTPICWLTGPVGSGKTSIAQTLAKKCSEQNTLVANFFFDRDKRSRIEPLIPSLVYTMCISHYPAIPYVERIYRHEQSIFQNSDQDYQFRKLLLEVLSVILEDKSTKSRPGIMQSRSRLVIVIDGIDRCSDEREMNEFVKMLVGIPSGSNPKLLKNVRILLTGRLADHFEEARESKSEAFRQFVKEINIQDIDATETTKDIRKFIKDRLKGIQRGSSTSSFTLQRSISSDEQLGGLVALSKGSFHVAQAILHYLDHKDMSKRLSGLLQSSNDRLYNFFTEVLDQSSDFEEVLGIVTYLNSPLSLTALRRIFTSHQIDPFPSLFRINALLSIPADDKQPIQPICESLWEYLKAPLDSGGSRFDGLKSHYFLAASCLEIIAQLSEGDVAPSHSGRSTKLGWVQHAEAQQYASIHWFGHLLECVTMSKSGRLKEIAELMSKSNVLEENISILLDSSKSSFVLWTNILIFRIDNTQKMLEDMKQLNTSMEGIPCFQNLAQKISELIQKLTKDIVKWNKHVNNFAKTSQAGFGSYSIGTSSSKPNTLENIGNWRKQQQIEREKLKKLKVPRMSRSSTTSSQSPVLPEFSPSLPMFSESDFPWLN